MKPILFSAHALQQLALRGASEEEVRTAIREGEPLPAREGRMSFRKNFPYRAAWKGKLYDVKQVMPIVIEETEALVVVTVYVFYFGGES